MQLRQSHAPRTQVWPSISNARSYNFDIEDNINSTFARTVKSETVLTRQEPSDLVCCLFDFCLVALIVRQLFFAFPTSSFAHWETFNLVFFYRHLESQILRLSRGGFSPPGWDRWSQAFLRWSRGGRSCTRENCRFPKWTSLQKEWMRIWDLKLKGFLYLWDPSVVAREDREGMWEWGKPLRRPLQLGRWSSSPTATKRFGSLRCFRLGAMYVYDLFNRLCNI